LIGEELLIMFVRVTACEELVGVNHRRCWAVAAIYKRLSDIFIEL